MALMIFMKPVGFYIFVLMETTGLQEENNKEELQQPLKVTEDMRSYIYDTAKWAHFIGIAGYVIAFLLFLMFFSIGVAVKDNPELGAMLGTSKIDPGTLKIVLLIYALVVFYPSFLLVRYAARAKKGVLYGDQAALDEAMSRMRSLFKFWGILMLIFIALNVLLMFARF